MPDTCPNTVKLLTRRRFLEQSAKSAAGAGLAFVLPERLMTKSVASPASQHISDQTCIGLLGKVKYINCWYRSATTQEFVSESGHSMMDTNTDHLALALQAMGVGAPRLVTAHGSRDRVIAVMYEYPGFVVNCSYQGTDGYQPYTISCGVRFHGSQGSMAVTRSGWEIFPEDDKLSAAKGGFSPMSRPNIRGILDGIDSDKQPVSDVEMAYNAALAHHLGYIACTVGHTVEWDDEKREIINDARANQIFSLSYRKPWKLPV
jgi:hypothetical protein